MHAEHTIGINALIAAGMASLSAAHLHEIALIVGFISAAIQAIFAAKSRNQRRGTRRDSPRSRSASRRADDSNPAVENQKAKK